jgi:hypothetical protein
MLQVDEPRSCDMEPVKKELRRVHRQVTPPERDPQGGPCEYPKCSAARGSAWPQTRGSIPALDPGDRGGQPLCAAAGRGSRGRGDHGPQSVHRRATEEGARRSGVGVRSRPGRPRQACQADPHVGEEALGLSEGFRIFSAYDTPVGRAFIITEADRSSTCILRPEDY